MQGRIALCRRRGGHPVPEVADGVRDIDFTNAATADFARDDVASVKYKTGYDVDLIGGYDFGMFRLEGELGYKRAKAKSLRVNDAFVTALNTGAGTDFFGGDFDIGGKTSVLSGMVNGLVDFGGNGGPGVYAGGGVGYANVKQFGDSDGKFAWQLLAGAYMPVSNNLDIGLKYRYFRAGSSNSSEAVPFTAGATTCGALPCSGGVATFDADSRFSSHSLLASLVYNFGGERRGSAASASAAASAAEAPATQTCPDGSVILATAACAVPPPPPPAPVAQGERGQQAARAQQGNGPGQGNRLARDFLFRLSQPFPTVRRNGAAAAGSPCLKGRNPEKGISDEACTRPACSRCLCIRGSGLQAPSPRNRRPTPSTPAFRRSCRAPPCRIIMR